MVPIMQTFTLALSYYTIMSYDPGGSILGRSLMSRRRFIVYTVSLDTNAYSYDFVYLTCILNIFDALSPATKPTCDIENNCAVTREAVNMEGYQIP